MGNALLPWHDFKLKVQFEKGITIIASEYRGSWRESEVKYGFEVAEAREWDRKEMSGGCKRDCDTT